MSFGKTWCRLRWQRLRPCERGRVCRWSGTIDVRIHALSARALVVGNGPVKRPVSSPDPRLPTVHAAPAMIALPVEFARNDDGGVSFAVDGREAAQPGTERLEAPLGFSSAA